MPWQIQKLVCEKKRDLFPIFYFWAHEEDLKPMKKIRRHLSEREVSEGNRDLHHLLPPGYKEKKYSMLFRSKNIALFLFFSLILMCIIMISKNEI